jgi:hypothetical protein
MPGVRWFGIDREDRQKGVLQDDVREVGCTCQLTDIDAAAACAP